MKQQKKEQVEKKSHIKEEIPSVVKIMISIVKSDDFTIQPKANDLESKHMIVLMRDQCERVCS